VSGRESAGERERECGRERERVRERECGRGREGLVLAHVLTETLTPFIHS
jgi:hypothetical protein